MNDEARLLISIGTLNDVLELLNQQLAEAKECNGVHFVEVEECNSYTRHMRSMIAGIEKALDGKDEDDE